MGRLVTMSELPLEDAPDVVGAAHEAARGQVVYLTEHGERLAAIVPAEFAAALEGMTPEEAIGLLEDLADVADARASVAELAAGATPVSAEHVWAELGIDQ
jgi:antitoxin (DNA-binding transcriptional repressor) of toxin-antitoxin stability system